MRIPWLRLYPAAWRERYGDEMEALLGDLGAAPRLDLLRGALDAHLHPLRAPSWPWLAASIGGAGWTLAAAVTLAQPVAPDWPGYLVDTLPLVLAVVPLLGLAAIGASTRLGDADPPLARAGRVVVVLATVAWSVLLVAAVAGIAYGWPLGAAAQAAALGSVLLGLALLRAGDTSVGVALVVAAACLAIGGPLAALAHGVAWAAIAASEQRQPRPAGDRPRGRAA